MQVYESVNLRRKGNHAEGIANNGASSVLDRLSGRVFDDGNASLRGLSLCGGDGQSEEEGCTRAQLAFGANQASVGEHDMLGDGQAKAGATGLPRAGLIDAVKALEDPVQV